MDKPFEYLNNLQSLLGKIIETQLPQIERAAKSFADALSNDRPVFLFGTGHSHMLAEELFYRAGGIVMIQPMLEPDLMLHISASGSTLKERETGYAERLFESYGLEKGDVLVIISNSGRNGVCVDLALLAKEKGVTVIALTNLRHSSSAASRHPSGKRLFEIADIVLDNCGCVGDASIEFPSLNRYAGPTSTSAGAAILNAVVCGAVELLLQRGVVPALFSSSNVDGGDEINDALVEEYKNLIRFL